jgi:hypothetical protein
LQKGNDVTKNKDSFEPDGFVQLAARFVEATSGPTMEDRERQCWPQTVAMHADTLRKLERARLAQENAEASAEALRAGLCNGRGTFGSYSDATCMGCTACTPDEEASPPPVQEVKMPLYIRCVACGARPGDTTYYPSIRGEGEPSCQVCGAHRADLPPPPAPPEIDPYVRAACAALSIGSMPWVEGPDGKMVPPTPETWAQHVLRHAEALRAAVEGRRGDVTAAFDEGFVAGLKSVRCLTYAFPDISYMPRFTERLDQDIATAEKRTVRRSDPMRSAIDKLGAAVDEIGGLVREVAKPVAPPPSDPLPPYVRPAPPPEPGPYAYAERMREAEEEPAEEPPPRGKPAKGWRSVRRAGLYRLERAVDAVKDYAPFDTEWFRQEVIAALTEMLRPAHAPEEPR